MIGVIANPSDYHVVSEFFQLFKTPWEFYRSGQEYDVLLCTEEGAQHQCNSKLVVVYGGQRLAHEKENEVSVNDKSADSRSISYNGIQIPLYGDSATFQHEGISILYDQGSKQSAGYICLSGKTALVRMGYDLFSEVRILLMGGQPIVNAPIPALELHIMLLRDLIVGCDIPLIEIPPIPAGYQFIACLTHDVDHPSIRQHKCDHTMFGFLYRAILGSLIDVIRKRIPVRDLLKNWTAAFLLPFVHFGLAKDFWSEFDMYKKLEGGVNSSFFVIPFSGRPGSLNDGPAPSRRSASYCVDDIATQIRSLMSAGCEIGVHGIDAWRDIKSAREELERVSCITGKHEIGVRMHWLYFDEGSPAILEEAGFDYDSTIGYNGAIGFRAGTAQAYKPLDTTRLLELPLHVMDTSLFFRGHLNQSPVEARKSVDGLIESVARFGGCLTVNWHDRSIAPERLWCDFYVELIEELKKRGAWLASGTEAVSWFRKRRSATFENLDAKQSESGAIDLGQIDDLIPGLQLHSYPSELRASDEPSRVANSQFIRNIMTPSVIELS